MSVQGFSCSFTGNIEFIIFSPREMSSPVQSDEDEVEEVEFVSVSDVYTVILFFVCFFKSMGSKDHFKKPIVQHFDLA